MRNASLFSLVVGCMLVTLKLAAWSATDSLSILSSLADSMLDVMASTINFIVIRYSLQPADHEHRFGHGKAEDLATLAQSTFIFGSGLFLIFEGIKRLFSPEPLSHGFLGVGVMILSILMTVGLLSYQRYVVRKTSSSAIHADAMHYFADFIANCGVILALVLTSLLGWKNADPVIALCIAAYILWGAFEIAQKASQNLMDREFSDGEREEIKRIVRSHPDAISLHDLRTRRSGIHSFIQFHLELDDTISLRRAHQISDEVEEILMKAFPNAEILIHQDPLHGDKK